jgi:hypothetical protein
LPNVFVAGTGIPVMLPVEMVVGTGTAVNPTVAGVGAVTVVTSLQPVIVPVLLVLTA